MIFATRIVAALLAAAATEPAPTSAPAPEAAAPVPADALTLDQAIARALSQHPSLSDAEQQIAGAEANRAATRANYGPKLRAEANVIVWDEEQVLSLGGGSVDLAALPPPTTPYEQLVAGLVQGLSKPTQVRDQVTSTATFQLIQPLVGLYSVSQASELMSIGVDVARMDLAVARRKIVINVIESWYRVLQAQAIRTAAQKSVESLEAQEKKVLALEAGGVVGHHDVLRLQAALSAARQRVVEIAAGVDQALAGLSVAMGELPGTVRNLAPGDPAWSTEPVPAPAEAREKAFANRVEIAEVQRRIDQAEQVVKVTRAKMLPDVNLIGQYQHNEGSKLQADNSYFGGAFLSWTAFEWGATSKQIDVAETNVGRARAGLEQVRQGVAFEVEAAWLSHDAATKATAVAEAGIAQAEEALRLTRARFDVQQATTSDVLDAETALTAARVNLETARYGRLTALARLRHALGAPLTAEEK